MGLSSIGRIRQNKEMLLVEARGSYHGVGKAVTSALNTKLTVHITRKAPPVSTQGAESEYLQYPHVEAD